ncbi:PAS domain-containing protein [Halomicrobium mukohataei]|uniref:histidine kinase n=1 Tax=Halomicrobium mukohataei TaxID=57705 RepID=A0A847U6G5_9EURY|nr:ATP-binding protein [Halomicrobium mukohataei]NLV08885.1 PAS domain-containing protein [Halomicrobium mukohataei]
MDDLLSDPTTVLVVGGRERAVAPTRSASAAGSIGEVVVVDSVEAALTTLSDRRDVGCVLVTAAPTDASVVEACEQIHAVDEHRPILLSLGDSAGRTAARATQAGASEIVLDEDDLPDRLAAAVDRYERRRDQAAESSMFRTLLDGVEGAVYVKDREARHLRKSTSPGDFSSEAFIGQTDVDMYGESDNAVESYEDDLRVIEEGEPLYDKEASYTTPDGTHWSWTTKLPWEHDGEVVGLVGWTRDVTEIVERRERLKCQDQRMEEFVRSIRHDMKSPIQIASGRIALARETGDVTTLEQASEAITRIDEILDDLTQTVLENSSLSPEGVGVGQSSPVSLPALVEDVWELVGFDAASLEVEFGPDAVVNAPRSSIRPVLENLLKNAVDHGCSGVTVRVGPLPSGGLYVADDGPGIPETERELVFEDGYTTTRTGTGTGLSIVTNIAEQRNWELSLTESWAGGARIELRNTLVVPDPSVAPTADETIALTEGVDVGDVLVAGESTAEEGRWHVTGSGKNIYGEWNEFHYRCARVEGPVRIEGQFTDLDGANEWSTAGLMVRDGLDDEASYGHVGLTEGHGTKIDWRTSQGASGTTRHLEESSLDAPWYRVDRIDDTLTIYCSTDGRSWRPLDQRRIELTDPVWVGTTVCSVQPEELARSTVEHLTVTRLDPE